MEFIQCSMISLQHRWADLWHYIIHTYIHIYLYYIILYYIHIVYKPFLECVSRIRPCKRQLEGLDPNRASDFTRDERSLPYLTCLPHRPSLRSTLLWLPFGNGDVSLSQSAWQLSLPATMGYSSYLLVFSGFFAHRTVNFLVLSTTPCQTLFPICRASRSLDRLLAQHLINPNLFQPQLQPQL